MPIEQTEQKFMYIHYFSRYILMTMTNKELVERYIQAFNKADIHEMDSLSTEDITFHWPGSFRIGPGKKEVRGFFEVCPEILDCSLGQMVEEGDKVVASGSVTTKHEDGSVRKSHFCDIYLIDHHKIKSVESYVVFEAPKARS